MGLADYAVAFPLDHVIERGRDSVIEAPVFKAGALVAPDSGTCTVYDAVGNEISTGTVTTPGDLTSYSVPLADTSSESLADDWTAKWDLTYSTENVVAVNVAHLARHRLYRCVSTADLTGPMSSLDASQGAKAITSVSDLSPYIREAEIEIEDRLIKRGRRSELVLSPSSLRRPMKHLSLAFLFDDLANRLNAAYADIAQRNRNLYEAAWDEVNFTYDADEDGLPDAGRLAASPTVWLC